MSNYGPKSLKLYNEADNLRRKSNNLTDQIEIGQNRNVKAYSTKPGQLSAKQQAQKLINKYKCLNRKQPVKQLSKMKCPVEKMAFLMKLKAV